MLIDAKRWWERNGEQYQGLCEIPVAVLYGVGCPDETELKLIGAVADKDVLEIGCGGAQSAIAFAKLGARVTALDVAASEISFARKLASDHSVTIEFHEQDMSDLAPIASTSQDVVFSANAFGYVDDLDRCFAEVHRVLRPDGLFVWAMGHPMVHVIDAETLEANRSYFDTDPVIEGHETGCAFASVHRKISDYFNLLVGAGFRVDRMIEPDSRQRYEIDPWHGLWGHGQRYLSLVPGSIIFKCHKPAQS